MIRLSMLLSCLVPLAACDDASSTGDDDPIAPDAEVAGCDPAAGLPTQWRPIDTVSTGEVQTSSGGGVTTLLVDATAGGLAGAADNPYIYVDLVGGAKVEVSDVDAFEDATWQLALKRSSFRVNGGDSGPGGVEAAVVDAATMAEVTTAPSGFVTDDWADDDCAVAIAPGGEPLTAMADWYDYDPTTHVLSPKPQVWILRIDGDDYKLRIDSYYADAANEMRGAYYRLEWAPL